jgi:hypothetical protein
MCITSLREDPIYSTNHLALAFLLVVRHFLSIFTSLCMVCDQQSLFVNIFNFFHVLFFCLVGWSQDHAFSSQFFGLSNNKGEELSCTPTEAKGTSKEALLHKKTTCINIICSTEKISKKAIFKNFCIKRISVIIILVR